eukprot:TRINITY_DN64554_c0_g1_i1.p1 TRINITY_DN64554_c0_g1~~TRINITY_DN64554_c0_g1_i1.p1  ORF type:complete len:220 (-),score=60.54 TRINITY_DN64554_c0_g1_i1:149-808(-)
MSRVSVHPVEKRWRDIAAQKIRRAQESGGTTPTVVCGPSSMGQTLVYKMSNDWNEYLRRERVVALEEQVEILCDEDPESKDDWGPFGLIIRVESVLAVPHLVEALDKTKGRKIQTISHVRLNVDSTIVSMMDDSEALKSSLSDIVDRLNAKELTIRVSGLDRDSVLRGVLLSGLERTFIRRLRIDLPDAPIAKVWPERPPDYEFRDSEAVIDVIVSALI